MSHYQEPLIRNIKKRHKERDNIPLYKNIFIIKTFITL